MSTTTAEPMTAEPRRDGLVPAVHVAGLRKEFRAGARSTSGGASASPR